MKLFIFSAICLVLALINFEIYFDSTVKHRKSGMKLERKYLWAGFLLALFSLGSFYIAIK